jgi:hypothetical protein
MKISSEIPFTPVSLTLTFETAEEKHLFGQMSTYCMGIPTFMKLKGNEFNTMRMMLDKIASEIVEL